MANEFGTHIARQWLQQAQLCYVLVGEIEDASNERQRQLPLAASEFLRKDTAMRIAALTLGAGYHRCMQLELALKSLIALDGKPPDRGRKAHSCSELWNLLQDSDRAIIEQSFLSAHPQRKITEVLAEASKQQAWRYGLTPSDKLPDPMDSAPQGYLAASVMNRTAVRIKGA